MIRHYFLLVSLVLASGLHMESSAIHSAAPGPSMSDAMTPAPSLTVNDFLAIDIGGYRTAEGKKMKWTQRIAMNMVQKKLARKVRKGKIDGEASMSTVMAAPGTSKFGLLSVIFSVAGLVVPYFGLAMIIAGLVLGIIGIRRDPDPTLAIIGTVISSVFILLLLIAIAALAAGGWFWW